MLEPLSRLSSSDSFMLEEVIRKLHEQHAAIHTRPLQEPPYSLWGVHRLARCMLWASGAFSHKLNELFTLLYFIYSLFTHTHRQVMLHTHIDIDMQVLVCAYK